MVLSFFDNTGGLWMCALFVVSSQRWCSHTNAVTVPARYLPCFVATIVLSKEAVSVCARYLLFFLTTLVLWDKCNVRARYFLTALVLSDKPVCVCARYLLQVGAVRQSSLCMCTLFAPSWCCQINQSLYVRVICYVLSQCWCCQINQSVCARYLLSSHNVGAVRRTSLSLIFEQWYNSVSDINNNMKFIVGVRRLKALC